MRKNLAITKGAIVSEAVMMVLAPTLGRQHAHDLVYDLCRMASSTGRPLVDVLDEASEIRISRAELERICDPSNYLGFSQTMTDDVLENL